MNIDGNILIILICINNYFLEKTHHKLPFSHSFLPLPDNFIFKTPKSINKKEKSDSIKINQKIYKHDVNHKYHIFVIQETIFVLLSF